MRPETAGSRLVVRALPDSATASSDQLAVDLDAALERALRKVVRDADPAEVAP